MSTEINGDGPLAAGTDTRDMLVVHTAFRREFGLAPGLVQGVAEGDTVRSVLVGDHLRLLVAFLRIHHGGEDRLLWPKLAQRVPERLTQLITLMDAQHHQIDVSLHSVDDVLRRWRDESAAVDRDRLVAALVELNDALLEHLAAEEQHILPLAARYVRQDEWDELAAETKSIALRKLPIAFGMLMYQGDPEVIEVILAGAPALPRTVLPWVAPRAYARYARRVYGTATP